MIGSLLSRARLKKLPQHFFGDSMPNQTGYTPTREEIEEELKALRREEGWLPVKEQRIPPQLWLVALCGVGLGLFVVGSLIWLCGWPDNFGKRIGATLVCSGLTVASASGAIIFSVRPLTRDGRESLAVKRLKERWEEKQSKIKERFNEMSAAESRVLNEARRRDSPLRCLIVKDDEEDKLVSALSLLKAGILTRSDFSIEGYTTFMIDDIAFELWKKSSDSSGAAGSGAPTPSVEPESAPPDEPLPSVAPLPGSQSRSNRSAE